MNHRTTAGRPAGRRDRTRGVATALAALLALPAAVFAQTTPYQSPQRAMVGTGFGQVDAPRGGYVEPRLEVAAQYADNINLAEASAGQVNTFGVELAPGIYASYSTDRVSAALDYSLIARAWEDSDYDDLGHQLAANGRWTALPELLYLDADASYGDTVIDPAQGLNYGNMGVFGQSNMAEQATASVTPQLRKRFGILEFNAAYSYGRVWYLDKGKGQSQTPTVSVLSYDDSVDQRANVSLGTDREGRKLNGRVFYEWDKSEYDRAVPYEYERAGLGASFLMTRTISFVGDVGKESSLDQSTTQGGLDSDFWSAGLRYAPDPRTSFEGRYGERFFGTSYSGSISRRARYIDVTASYSEDPNVQTRGLSLGEFDPGTLPPGTDPNIDGGRFNAQPYVSKDARIDVVAKGSRTEITLNVYDTRRDFLRDAFGDEHGTGVYLSASRQMASNFSIDGSAAYMDISRGASTTVLDPLADSHDYDTQFIFRANQTFGPKLTASLEAGYLNRSGSTNYDGWWIGLRGRWQPSSRNAAAGHGALE